MKKSKKTIKRKEKKKIQLEDYLKESSTSLVALSIFLLITFQLKMMELPLSKELSLLSAGISYIILIYMIEDFEDEATLTLNLFSTVFSFFALAFCIWVILNLALPAETFYEQLMLGIWVVAILIPTFKRFSRKKQ